MPKQKVTGVNNCSEHNGALSRCSCEFIEISFYYSVRQLPEGRRTTVRRRGRVFFLNLSVISIWFHAYFRSLLEQIIAYSSLAVRDSLAETRSDSLTADAE